jgi:phosphoribosyl 1,2-cyclic phosphodiesterase
MKVCILGSGSKGNTTYVEIEQSKFLIDCGLSHRQITNRLKQNELSLDNLDGILITHEHGDHIAGLNVTLPKTDALLYVTEETLESFYHKYTSNLPPDKVHHILPHQEFDIKDVRVFPLSISHDASDAVGYVIYHKDKKLVYITDIGYLPQKDYELLSNADMYVFESNYDVHLLFTSNRPFYLKQRIDSVKGHMSNADTAYNLAQLVGNKTKHIVLAHPSRECNTVDLVLDTISEVFEEYGIDQTQFTIEVATQDVPTKIYEF